MVETLKGMVSDLNRYVFLNESFSLTPNMIYSIIHDNDIIDRLIEGNGPALDKFFNGHRKKMKNFILSVQMLNEDNIDLNIRKMNSGGISPITFFDNDYPYRLRNIDDPPLVLFHIGTLFDLSKCVAVSGTRSSEKRINRITYELASVLVENDYTVASGLAKGVDSYAHEGALSNEKGSSVAVMANGLDRVIPKCNVDLAKRIALRGAVLSEKALRPEPSKYDFIRRNRIISGISGVQIIMESSGSGGTEHQFRIALKQGKPVVVYSGPGLPEKGKRSVKSMISRGAKEFSTIEEALDLIKAEWPKEGSTARRENFSLDRWS